MNDTTAHAPVVTRLDEAAERIVDQAPPLADDVRHLIGTVLRPERAARPAWPPTAA